MDTKPDGSEIVLHKTGAISITGKDAMSYYRALHLAGFLKLFRATGVIPTRGVTGPVMLKLAAEITGKTYKRGQYEQAETDVRTWADTMKAGLPIKDERETA